jgi:Ni,Fe-hydrogenase maturation factor
MDPELADDVARAESVLFIDCPVNSPLGSVRLTAVEPASAGQGIATHHTGAAELLALARDYYASSQECATADYSVRA